MRILLTGAGGQLGHDLVSVFSEDDLAPFDHRGLDITDRGSVHASVGRVRPDWIINSAAYNEVDAAEDHSELAFAVNAAGAGYLAEAARQTGASIVHVSTDYVFDGRKGIPYVEADPAAPLNAYGRSKLEGELGVGANNPRHVILRWTHGQRYQGGVGAYRTTGINCESKSTP